MLRARAAAAFAFDAGIECIPAVSVSRDFADLFRKDGRYEGTTHPEDAGYVPDPADRKFAALAREAEAILITNDEDSLGNRGRADVCVLVPDEAMTTASLTEGREET